MTREELLELVANASRRSLAAGEPFRVICADPPWQPHDALPGGRGAVHKYPTLDVWDLKRLPLPAIAEDAILFLWRLSSMQREALDVVDAWRFKVKTEIVWQKLTPTGKPFFGMGRITRGSHETCLVATRGRPVIRCKSIRSTFPEVVPRDARGKYIHSAKPETFYTEVVQRLAGGPYVEIFSRRTRPGWHMIGNQVGKLDA